MKKKNMYVHLPKKCASCNTNLERSNWLRCNTCVDVNLCIDCAFLVGSSRHPCLDQHTFTAMFRIHELSLHNYDIHDEVLAKVMKKEVTVTCNRCYKILTPHSWVRCNMCQNYNLCMNCWSEFNSEHSLNAGADEPHTFTSMTNRYHVKRPNAPTCALLCKEEHTLALFKDIGIKCEDLLFDSLFDRAYCLPTCTELGGSMHTRWCESWEGAKSKLIGYYCPAGWRRFSLMVGIDDFKRSTTVYHGTRPQVISKIYKTGLLARTCQHECSAAYVSPSVIYCAHPRYARVTKMELDGKQVYVQFVAELRVNLDMLKTYRTRETLAVGSDETIDANFPENEGLELLLCKEPSGCYLTPEDGVFMTGVMVRALDHDPLNDAESWWWTKWKSANFIKQKYYTYGINCQEPFSNNGLDELTSGVVPQAQKIERAHPRPLPAAQVPIHVNAPVPAPLPAFRLRALVRELMLVQAPVSISLQKGVAQPVVPVNIPAPAPPLRLQEPAGSFRPPAPELVPVAHAYVPEQEPILMSSRKGPQPQVPASVRAPAPLLRVHKPVEFSRELVPVAHAHVPEQAPISMSSRKGPQPQVRSNMPLPAPIPVSSRMPVPGVVPPASPPQLLPRVPPQSPLREHFLAPARLLQPEQWQNRSERDIISDQNERSYNVIVVGLSSSQDGTDDKSLFDRIIRDELNLNVSVQHCKRIGKIRSGRPQNLLVTLSSPEEATLLINNGKLLRNSDNDYIRKNVYINADLSPAEAHAAYKQRCERRRRFNQN